MKIPKNPSSSNITQRCCKTWKCQEKEPIQDECEVYFESHKCKSKPTCPEGEITAIVPINKLSTNIENRCCPSWKCQKVDQLPCVLRMGDVLFDFGQFVLSQKHDVYIQQLLCILSSDAALTHLGNGKVGSYMLQGHTDSKGSLGFNSILGLQRAISIYNRIKTLALDMGDWEQGVETVLEQPTCEVCYKYEFAKAQYNDDEDIPLRRSTGDDNKHITGRAVTRKRETRLYPRQETCLSAM